MEWMETKVWLLEFPTPTTKFVALALARTAAPSGACFTTQSAIARMTGLTRQTVAKHLADLIKEGWLVESKGRPQGGGPRVPRYWLTLPAATLPENTIPKNASHFLPPEGLIEEDQAEPSPYDNIGIDLFNPPEEEEGEAEEELEDELGLA